MALPATSSSSIAGQAKRSVASPANRYLTHKAAAVSMKNRATPFLPSAYRLVTLQ